MTICLPVMSIVASFQYQIVFFWHTENYGLIHCPFTNRHETALLPYPISNTAPYVSLVLNAIPRTALPYSPEGTTMNVGQLRSI